MDEIIPEDYFLADKTPGILLQNGNDTFSIQDGSALNVEPIFTGLVDGNATWTIGGVPVYLNSSLTSEQEEQGNTLFAETVSNTKLENIDPGTEGFPIEIPGKGFITSSGLYFSNELLLQLNLQNGNEELLQKSSTVEVAPKKTATPAIKAKRENNPHPLELVETEITDSGTKALDEFIEIVSVHKCKSCAALFERYDDIAEHIQKTCQQKVKPKVVCPSPRVQKMSSLLLTDKNKMPLVKDIYLCGMCENAGYENLDNLKRHMLAKHNLTYSVEKEEGSEESSESKLRANRLYFQNIVNKQQTEGKKVKCLIKGCDVRFSKPELMMKHHECHVNGEKKKFKCLECDKVFFIWRLCSAHLWKCHKMDIGLYTCTICNAFKSLSPHSLLLHMGIHDTVKPLQPFLCAECGKEFKLLSQLRNHENIHKHSLEGLKRPVPKKTCSICNKVFSNSKILKKHIQAVHNKFKPFICNICGHQCARKSMLELHLRQHTGEKPYKCEVCDYKTGDHNSLRRHISRHYGLTKYSCPHCNYHTIQSNAYKIHVKRKHPGKDGVFSCIICSFDTVNEQMYHDHLKEHSIEVESVNKNTVEVSSSSQKIVPNLEDEETQPGLFSSDHIDDMTIDTGGITIPAGSELQV